jgi:cardiolipin synthase
MPRNMVYPIRGMYLNAIDRASHHIYLTHAYFIPDQDVLSALIRAARRGVDVRIIIPAESNHIVADWLSRGFYSHLLRNGVRLLLYQGAMVHAKTATIDGQWSTIGTANIDRLSLLGNYEINMEVFNPGVARQMEEIFDIDSSNTIELTLPDWQRRHAMVKFSETVLTPLRPLL